MENKVQLTFLLGVLVAPWSTSTILLAQQGPNCVLQFGLDTQDRRFPGSVQVECPGGLFHSWPWGNWGVDSNVGTRRDGHQFNGWCNNNVVCDYSDPPNCWIACTDGWYEWNSCTDIFPMLRGNCYYYNDDDNCTKQITSQGVNNHGGGFDTIPVTCPIDWDGDRICDSGGCMDLGAFTLTNNWMSVYELDPLSPDDFVWGSTFPDLTVYPSCTPQGCGFARSSWVLSYQTYPVNTQLSLGIAWAVLSDPNSYCQTLAQSDPRYDCY